MAMMNDNGENGRSLPDGWEWSTLDKYRKNKRESVNPAKSPNQKFELYSIPSFESGKPEFVSGKDVGSSKQIVHTNEVLISKINPRINRSWVVGNHSEYPKIASTEWFVFDKVEGLNPKYLCYFMQMDSFRDYLAANVSGVGGSLMRARSASLENYPFPLAPLSEQEKIVSRIEELFSDLDAGMAALERVRMGLKRYKASVLKAACEGKLFGDVELGEEGLPIGWRWATVGEIGEISGGLTKNSKRDALKKKMPYLRVANVYANELQLDDVSEIGVEEKEIKRALLQDGDLLVVEGNGSPDQIGRVAIWNGSISPCLHQNHIIKVRFQPKEVTEYVLYWLLSEGGREKITKVASSTSGLYTLSLSKVSNLPIPLPPLEEQRRIVADVERRLSEVGEVESAVEVGLVRAGRLRQSVLRSAFEGRL